MTRIWTIAWHEHNTAHFVSDLTKKEAKRFAKGLMETYCKNAIMSRECREFYIQRNGEIILQKADDMIFLNGEYMNPCEYTIDEIIALI